MHAAPSDLRGSWSAKATSRFGSTTNGRPLHPDEASYASPMTDLAGEHSREYPPGTPPLSPDEAAELQRQVPKWELEDNRALRREFAFDDFSGAFGLVVRVALLAEAESHHPEIELEWGRAAFRTWTHTASGLSRNDFILAARIDLLAET
jgi:4a-hydroxytetrahydrobiopterin dehydratase